MKNFYKLILLVLFFVLFFSPQPAFSQGLSSNELIKNAKEYDGKLIVYSGEVIGDLMSRGEFTWVNINDGDNAISVWMSAALMKEINLSGGYKSRGDIIEIVGIFHHSCLEHGGDLDIHAQALRKLKVGRIVNHRLNTDKVNISLILLVVIFLIWILILFKKQ